MDIGGFQKLTLLDYPEQVACLVFTRGCDFRCPYCHNASLVDPAQMGQNRPAPSATEMEILEYLGKRRGVLDGLVITGGEPLLQQDLEEFIRKVRALGYLIKLDTNGSFPEKLQDLLAKGLLDYVAMDVKHTKQQYGALTGCDQKTLVKKLEQSMKILRKSGVTFEFRTTFVRGLHTIEDAEQISEWIAGDQPYYLQSYVDSGDVLHPENLEAFSPQELSVILETVKKNCPQATLRNI